MVVGIAGCGRMGRGMLTNLRRAGIAARGFDVRDLGTDVMTDATAFADGLTTLITVVRDVEQTDQVLFTDQGLALCPSLETLIVSSTLSPKYTRDLRHRVSDRIRLIDAPMSGAQVKADAGTLSFMLGGAAADLDRLQPLFDAMGRVSHRMGDFGAGMTAKVLNNLIAASSLAATRLALDWGRTAGLDPVDLVRLFDTSSGQTWISSGWTDIEFAQAGLEPDNSIAILAKDVEAALDAAPADAETALPDLLIRMVRQLQPF